MSAEKCRGRPRSARIIASCSRAMMGGRCSRRWAGVCVGDWLGLVRVWQDQPCGRSAGERATGGGVVLRRSLAISVDRMFSQAERISEGIE